MCIFSLVDGSAMIYAFQDIENQYKIQKMRNQLKLKQEPDGKVAIKYAENIIYCRIRFKH